jgi:hypothetical protein
MCKFKLAATAAALAITNSTSLAAGPAMPGGTVAANAPASSGAITQKVQYIYTRRRVIVRRAYVPYWAGPAPAFYYGAYPVYGTYPPYAANAYVAAPAVTAPAPVVVAPAPLVAAPPPVIPPAPAPVITTAPAFPFSLF